MRMSGAGSSSAEPIELEDGDDDDDDGDDFGDESPYSAAHEKPPHCAAYDPKIIEITGLATSLVYDLSNVLGTHRTSSKDVDTMVMKASGLLNCPSAPKKTIMLLGATGDGKSSTTNSFVDGPDATKVGASGESCTCVPTLLTSGMENQKLKYAAELHFLDSQTHKSFLDEQIQYYTRFHVAYDQEWSGEEIEDFKSLANTAEKHFRALFCDKFDFDSLGTVKQYFTKHKEHLSMVVYTLNEWCGDLLRDCSVSNGHPMLRFEANSSKEINETTKPYMFEQRGF